MWHIALHTQMLWLHKMHDSYFLSLSLLSWSKCTSALAGGWLDVEHTVVNPGLSLSDSSSHRAERKWERERRTSLGCTGRSGQLRLFCGVIERSAPWENYVRCKAAAIQSALHAMHTRHERDTMTSLMSAVCEVSATSWKIKTWEMTANSPVV